MYDCASGDARIKWNKIHSLRVGGAGDLVDRIVGAFHKNGGSDFFNIGRRTEFVEDEVIVDAFECIDERSALFLWYDGSGGAFK